MTAPPPPPPTPSSDPSWPAAGVSGGAASFGLGGSGGRQPWWSTGRVIGAIVLVLVLMGGSAAAGFVVGVGVGGVGTISDVISDADGFTLDGALGSDDVPGIYGTDTQAESGPPLAVGARLTGSLVEGPVEHGLTVGGGSVAIEVVEADFDSVLVLLERDGTVIATDDDGGTDTLSRIEVELDEGTYLVRVQPWGGGSGGYTVAVD